MSERARVSIENPSNKTIWLPCAGSCQGRTCHKVLTNVVCNDASVGYEVQWSENHLTVQCPGCLTISFCAEVRTADEREWDPDENEWVPIVTREVYPPRIAGRAELEHACFLPPEVCSIYRETRDAICGSKPVLAGIGLRAIVETVCKEKAATGKKLQEQIDSLASMGLVTPEGAKILHSLRTLGNAAAHEVKPHTEEELGIALDVVEYLLQGVYILPQLAKRLPQPKSS